jgi:hypothetical protein
VCKILWEYVAIYGSYDDTCESTKEVGVFHKSDFLACPCRKNRISRIVLRKFIKFTPDVLNGNQASNSIKFSSNDKSAWRGKIFYENTCF